MSKRNKYFNEINFNYLPNVDKVPHYIKSLQSTGIHLHLKLPLQEFPTLLGQSSYFMFTTYLLLVQKSYQFSGYHFIFNCYTQVNYASHYVYCTLKVHEEVESFTRNAVSLKSTLSIFIPIFQRERQYQIFFSE